jgi:hypothetical protein
MITHLILTLNGYRASPRRLISGVLSTWQKLVPSGNLTVKTQIKIMSIFLKVLRSVIG